MADKTTPDVNAGTEEEKRTILSLSLTVSDKKALKLMAFERGTTMAAIVHEWIEKEKQDGGL